MGREDKVSKITELLGQTDSAHHFYEAKVLNGDRDTHWPEWYAEYLIGHGLDLLMGDRPATETLVGILTKCRDDHEICGSDLSWEEFTAARIVEKLV